MKVALTSQVSLNLLGLAESQAYQIFLYRPISNPTKGIIRQSNKGVWEYLGNLLTSWYLVLQL